MGKSIKITESQLKRLMKATISEERQLKSSPIKKGIKMFDIMNEQTPPPVRLRNKPKLQQVQPKGSGAIPTNNVKPQLATNTNMSAEGESHDMSIAKKIAVSNFNRTFPGKEYTEKAFRKPDGIIRYVLTATGQ